MIRLRHKALIQAFRILDQAMLVGTAVGIIYFRTYLAPKVAGASPTPDSLPGYGLSDMLGAVLLAMGWVAIFDYCVHYKADRFVALRAQLKDLLKATSMASFWLLVIATVFSIKSLHATQIVMFWFIVSSVGIVSRLLLRLTLVNARKSGYNYRYLLVIGTNPRSASLADRIEASPELGYKIVGFISENDEAASEWNGNGSAHREVIGRIEDLQTVLKRERVDEMMVSLPVESRFSDIMSVIRHARDLGIVVRVLPDQNEVALLNKMHLEEFDGEHVLTLFRENLLLQLFLKRMADIALSASALLVLSPVLVVVAAVIKATSPGPIFFSQDRVGMNQRRFRLYKFRSMVVDAEERKKELEHLNELEGPAFKIENDPRITRIGRFIRKTSIDELPQLFNVLRGEMSLVGPRPPLPDEVKRYEWLFRRRLSVKPGITCVWQVSGRSNTTFERWMEMDHEYIENWSLWLDLKILLMTVPAVLTGKGAS